MVVLRLLVQAQMVGLGPNVRNRAAGARFRVRCWKWPWRKVGGCDGVVGMRWWWCGGAAFGRASRGGWFLGKMSKTEPPGLSYGCAAGNGGRGQWGEVVWWCVRGSGGVVVPRLVTRMGAAGLRPKVRNRAGGAWLRVHRWKRLSQEMG